LAGAASGSAYIKIESSDIRWELVKRSHHRGIGPNDLLVAACAEVHGATVLHYDRDFHIIAEVTGQRALWGVPPGSIP
jgi:predicted nucleic acid-binding protein